MLSPNGSPGLVDDATEEVASWALSLWVSSDSSAPALAVAVGGKFVVHVQDRRGVKGGVCFDLLGAGPVHDLAVAVGLHGGNAEDHQNRQRRQAGSELIGVCLAADCRRVRNSLPSKRATFGRGGRRAVPVHSTGSR